MLRIKLDFPVPPSANNLWEIVPFFNPKTQRRAARLSRTKVYEKWIWTCRIIAGRVQKAKPPVNVFLTLVGGTDFNPRKRDGDNCIKPTIDLLKHLEVIPDDVAANVPYIALRYREPDRPGEEARIFIEVQEVSKEGEGHAQATLFTP